MGSRSGCGLVLVCDRASGARDFRRKPWAFRLMSRGSGGDARRYGIAPARRNPVGVVNSRKLAPGVGPLRGPTPGSGTESRWDSREVQRYGSWKATCSKSTRSRTMNRGFRGARRPPLRQARRPPLRTHGSWGGDPSWAGGWAWRPGTPDHPETLKPETGTSIGLGWNSEARPSFVDSGG
jgi:hypothetical protein